MIEMRASDREALRMMKMLEPYGGVAGLQRMLDLQRAVEAQLQLKKFQEGLVAAEVARAMELHAQLAEALKVRELESKWSELQRSIVRAVGIAEEHQRRWKDLHRIAETVLPAIEQVLRMSAFDRDLGRIMGAAEHLRWSHHLQATALPTLGFLARDWREPMALMTEFRLDGPGSGASIAWLTRHRQEPRVNLAALVRRADADAGYEAIIEDDVICGICGGPMLTLGTNVRWTGRRRGIQRRRIFPACATCSERERGEPGYLARALDELADPDQGVTGHVSLFAVFKGGQEGDGRRRATLRVVPPEDDD